MSVSFTVQRVQHQLRKKLKGGPVVAAHSHCVNHRAELTASKSAGCFYCCEIYSPNEIDEWIDDGRTAMGPRCSIDAVIGEASGFPATDPEFLKQMHEFWF